jgi:hypothetical protein
MREAFSLEQAAPPAWRGAHPLLPQRRCRQVAAMSLSLGATGQGLLEPEVSHCAPHWTRSASHLAAPLRACQSARQSPWTSCGGASGDGAHQHLCAPSVHVPHISLAGLVAELQCTPGKVLVAHVYAKHWRSGEVWCCASLEVKATM